MFTHECNNSRRQRTRTITLPTWGNHGCLHLRQQGTEYSNLTIHFNSYNRQLGTECPHLTTNFSFIGTISTEIQLLQQCIILPNVKDDFDFLKECRQTKRTLKVVKRELVISVFGNGQKYLPIPVYLHLHMLSIVIHYSDIGQSLCNQHIPRLSQFQLLHSECHLGFHVEKFI